MLFQIDVTFLFVVIFNLNFFQFRFFSTFFSSLALSFLIFFLSFSHSLERSFFFFFLLLLLLLLLLVFSSSCFSFFLLLFVILLLLVFLLVFLSFLASVCSSSFSLARHYLGFFGYHETGHYDFFSSFSYTQLTLLLSLKPTVRIDHVMEIFSLGLEDVGLTCCRRRNCLLVLLDDTDNEHPQDKQK